MKKRIKRAFLLIFSMLLLIVLVVIIYVSTMLPNVGEPEDIIIEVTPERVERGSYLANNVTVCMDCHIGRDWSYFSWPIIKGTEGQGGEIFDQSMGFPGKFVSRNITPVNLGEWTDGELLRAITTGVSRNNKPIFPVMPHANYGSMDKEDIKDIIAYIRTLEPIDHQPELSRSEFPMSLILNTVPKKANFGTRPPKTETLKYGKHLVNAAACVECHTQKVNGQVEGELFVYGFEFKFPDGAILRSANITPHETGIGTWTKELFVARFKAYSDSSYIPNKVKPGEFQTVTPWMFYGEMTEEDLGAIYEYLQNLKPVNQVVSVFEPANKLQKKSKKG
ncbi:cytochrome c [Antarcticibacterium sp. 1MA-6-2]|uniref:c-type cytochrome n=1 Tax=Antarcticibacterium sp. 1MA-6-2 TaxID=2908210 RepID=UPI001F397550|nr:c-type cytochrome [Antarcticibacterium sp. 1MA-6-2]UJH91155.1 cytochrome c [Antarcticibacterium sp. 1MA-6-2]